MNDGTVTSITKNKLSFDEVKKAAENEVKEEKLKEYKERYKEKLVELENAKLIVRNIEREIESLAEEFEE